MDTTTIELTTEQKEQLDDLKTGPREPYKAVIGRLINSYTDADDAAMGGHSDGSDVSALADEVAKLREEIENNPGRTADELEGRFR